MEGLRIEIEKENNTYKLNYKPFNPFGKVDPVFFSIALQLLEQEKEKIIGKIDSKYFDKEYFAEEGKSGKSGLDKYEEYSKIFPADHIPVRLEPFLKGDKTKKILEIGCAFGWTVDELRKRGYNAYGCDISEYAINKYPRPYLYVCDLTCKDLMGDNKTFSAGHLLAHVNYFDLIYSFNTFEHIATEDVRPFLMAINCLLKENGILMATIDPIWGTDLTHKTIKPREWWVEQAKKEGLEYLDKESEPFLKINGYAFRRI